MRSSDIWFRIFPILRSLFLRLPLKKYHKFRKKQIFLPLSLVFFQKNIIISNINVKYNIFNKTSYKGSGTGTYVYVNNFYGVAQATATSDYGVITSVEALEAAYAAYKAQ